MPKKWDILMVFSGRVLACLHILVCCSALGDGLQSRYFQSVFSGDIAWMLSEDIEDDGDTDFVQRFQERFVDRLEPAAFASIDDPFVRQVARHYQRYWIDSLLDPKTRNANELSLERQIEKTLAENGYEDDHTPVFDRLAASIRGRGWGFQGGRTPPLQDFMLWRSTDSRRYEVTLSDRVQTVSVHFLDGFVSQGWASFATFGHAGTGGWAAADGLYCVKSSYDLTSERFLVSYLKHEARHFADYKRFPNLQGADLEYRAKLTELIYAQRDQRALLGMFASHANGRTHAPHPLANWHVLNDLATDLKIEGQADNPGRWDSIDPQAIRTAARKLLEAHDQRLLNTGAATTAGVLIRLP